MEHEVELKYEKVNNTYYWTIYVDFCKETSLSVADKYIAKLEAARRAKDLGLRSYFLRNELGEYESIKVD